jgi:hypothetical protein
MSVPGSTAQVPTPSELCCFCGQHLEHADPERIRVGVSWEAGGSDHQQTFGAHSKCLTERLHETVKGQGPFFDDD